LSEISIYHADLQRVFGSASEAMLAAGLVPNIPGQPPMPLPNDFQSFGGPTADAEELNEQVARLRAVGSLPMPEGNACPVQCEVTTNVYLRDPAVVAWVLESAGGACEACGALGYATARTDHFLEVHHLIPLADGGPDLVSNAVAVCETCHGKLHRWIHRERMEEQLRASVSRLS